MPEINQLQKIQNRAARMITNGSFDAQADLSLKEWDGRPLRKLHGESKTMVFKSLNDLVPQNLCDLFTRNWSYSSYIPRYTGTGLRLPMKRLANGERFVSYRGAKLWNSLSLSA